MERHKQFYEKFFPGTSEFILYSGHYTHFVSATKIFFEKPIFGSGYRTFRTECSKHKGHFNSTNIYEFELFHLMNRFSKKNESKYMLNSL